MYPSGWPDVVQIDDLSLRYVRDPKRIMMGVQGAVNASSTQDWIAVVGSGLERPSQEDLIHAVYDRKISGLALMVLVDHLTRDAFGIDMVAAANLSGSVLGSWFQIATWAAMKGLRVHGMGVHELLVTCYSMQVDNCKEPKDLASLNRRVFGRSQPWGR